MPCYYEFSCSLCYSCSSLLPTASLHCPLASHRCPTPSAQVLSLIFSTRSNERAKSGNSNNNSNNSNNSSNNNNNHSKGKQNAQVASTVSPPVQEFAGNASSSSDPFLPLQLDADFCLNTDTGATSHMTPHRHWLCSYKPLRVPVKLANGSLVYSEGVGSLVFRPVVDGVQKRSIEFTCVLHVPLLRSNLLSILYFARIHHWHCHSFHGYYRRQ